MCRWLKKLIEKAQRPVKRRIKAIIRKEFLHIIRDTRSLAVAIVLPIVLLVLYGYGINLDVRHLRTAVLDDDSTCHSRALLASFEKSEYFDFVKRLDSYSDIQDQLDYNRAKVVIAVPKNFSRDLSRGKASVQIIVDGSDSSSASLAIGYASQIAQAYSKNLVVQSGVGELPGLNVITRYWYNPELNSANFIVPGLIAVILMLLSSLLTSMTIVRERERGSIEQIVVSPIRSHELILGKLVPYVIIAFFDVILVIIAAKYIFDVPLAGSVPLLLATSVLFLIGALGLGLLVSVIANSQLVAMSIALMATMLPMILLSGFMYPINSMPAPIRGLTYLLPARYYLVIVRGIFLKGVGLTVLWGQCALLLVAAVALILISARKFKKVL